MSRPARVVIPNHPHHITQRGNNRQDVFFVDEDRKMYLDILFKQSVRYGLKVEGYCLMSNHIHLITTPTREESLAKTIGCTHWKYAQYINCLHGRSGHLWQSRFYSCVLDEEHYWLAMAYIERNPVRANLVPDALDYLWSSAKAHVEGRDKTGLLDMNSWTAAFQSCSEWEKHLIKPEDSLQEIRSCTNRGRPLGSDIFIVKLEKALGRRLRPSAMGRPRKENAKSEKG